MTLMTCPKLLKNFGVESNLFSHKIILIDFSFNQNKQFCSQFLDELALCFDQASTENKSIFIIGDNNNNYMNKREKQNMDTIIPHYNLHLMNARTAAGP